MRLAPAGRPLGDAVSLFRLRDQCEGKNYRLRRKAGCFCQGHDSSRDRIDESHAAPINSSGRQPWAEMTHAVPRACVVPVTVLFAVSKHFLRYIYPKANVLSDTPADILDNDVGKRDAGASECYWNDGIMQFHYAGAIQIYP